MRERQLLMSGRNVRAIFAGAKTVTRRIWTDRHAAHFREGQLVDAWDQLPRVRGSHKVAEIRLTQAPQLPCCAN